MAEISIRVTNADQYLELAFASQGNLYLDTDENFGLRLSKPLEELTEANQLRQQAALTTTIPQTPRNMAVLQDYEANVTNRQTKYLDVEIRADGEPLPIDKLRVVRFQDRNRQIEIELIGTGWVQELEALPLREVELDPFEYSQAEVMARWANTTVDAKTILADFGGWRTPGNITRQDLRMVFNLNKLMKAAFCQAGEWTFKSPYWEGAAGSRVYCYLSGEDWFSYDGKADQFAVDLNIASPRAEPGPTDFITFDEVSDPLDLYNNFLRPNEYFYPGVPAAEDSLEIKFRVENLQVTLPPYGSGDPASFVFICLRNEGDFFDTLYFESWNGSETQEVNLDLSFEFSDPEGAQTVSYGFIMGYISLEQGNTTSYAWTLESCDLFIRPNPPFLVSGNTIPPNQLIDPNISALDLFKAMAHICNGKVLTDYVRKEVTLYPPYDIEHLEEVLEGFFQRTAPPVDISNLVEPDSREVENTGETRDRFIELKFRDSDDAYIAELNLNRELYSRRIDLGSGTAETTEIENELFEPTIDKEVDGATIGGSGVLDLPAIMDNTDGRISSDLGPRIFYDYGLITQQDSDSNNRTWTFEGMNIATLGYMSQNSQTRFAVDQTRVRLVFREYKEDLWRLFYRRWLNERYAALDFEFLLRIDRARYNSFDFRRRSGIFYRDAFLVFQMTSIRDFDVFGITSTPTEFKLIDC